MNLIGRHEEKAILENLFTSDRPEFLAIYGRRRIGKTFLIKQTFSDRDCYFFNVTGIQNGKMDTQIDRFIKEIGKIFYQGAEIKERKNWIDAFDALAEAIEKVVPKNKKVVLFFDEFPWMATHKSGLLSALEHRWNHTWSSDNRIKLIICGSSASWIINKIINNKGGLYNRITRQIHLMPFNLRDTAALLEHQKISLNHKQVTELYMTTGGVPYYLLPVEKNRSATQIVDALAFQQNCLLFNEFDKLFSSLFENAEHYIELLRIIAKNHCGVGQEEIIRQSEQISRGGRTVDRLKELEDTGFIISFTPHLHKKRGKYYRLIDEYTLFYLDWIEPVKNTLQKRSLESGYWLGKHNTPTWYTWAGYAFESICYKHINQIRKKLDISPTAVTNGWRYVPVSKSKEKGAQIDLLFDRDDDTITICEIKFTTELFEIKKDYAENLKNKIAVFKEKTRTKKQIFLVMISAYGIKENMYSEELVQSVVTLEDLFN
ncbi:MAG: AAA family ATPase [Gammaproteobacteria bacterium]|nr:AAA family ATPase [Gammaproteobacteria bacterium]MCW5582447.1 AAA family ATPase [Gammaproteobacteria bacterium]